VDFSTAPIGTASIELWPLMDFTSLVFAEAYNIMSPWPEEESRLNAVVRPFNLAVFINMLNTLSNKLLNTFYILI